MAGGTSVAIVRDIQMLFDMGTAGSLSDRQLLERFAARRDASSEAAFEVLVLRHGPMVLRVCRNVLRDPADAEDAFQATFLVLVRRSGSIRRLESVGGWLYGVACRVAARARVEAARRRATEQRAAARIMEAVDPTAADEANGAGLGLVVQEEVRRLPEKYRAVVALYYWEGFTQEQAAAQLGCPLGTVRSRLARARALLNRRLTRRGLAPLAGVMASSFDSASTAAVATRLSSVPPELVHSTVRAAVQIAAGRATAQVASALVTSLVHRVVWSMTMIKINSVVACVILVGLTGYGVGLAAQRAEQSRSVPKSADIDSNHAVQDAGLGQAQPGVSKNSTQGKPDAKTAGRETIYSNVPGQMTVLKVVPDGSMVKKEDVICELDSADFKNKLINQEITTMAARAIFENARVTREVAELAVIEYQEGIYVISLAEIEGDIKIAEAELALAQEELNSAKASRFDKLAIMRLDVAVHRAQFGLEKGQSRKKLLVDYTRGRTIKQLKSTVEKAHSDELAKKAIWELETSKERNLERQVASCTIVAPIGGKLVYDSLRPIVEGRTVGLRQLLFAIVPTPDTKSRSR